jgi:hypothetical protein
MPLFKKPEGQESAPSQDEMPGLTFVNPAVERRAAKTEQKAEKAEQRVVKKQDKQAGRLEKLFWESPSGQARAAKLSGQGWFQIELGVAETARTVGSWVFGDVQTKQRHNPGQGAVLTDIEYEGWSLFSADFVYEQTGAVSRDKLLSSGQSTRATGRTVGIYLFRATAAPARTDEPWLPGGESQTDEVQAPSEQ